MSENDPKREFDDQAYELENSYSCIGADSSFIPAKFGLCASCDSFYYAAMEYSAEYALCGYTACMRSWPSATNPVKKCVRYTKKGGLSLHEMANMAYFIDAGKKNKVGF